MMFAKRYEVTSAMNSSREWRPLAEKPKFVCTLIGSETFDPTKPLVHLNNVFFEDRIHDWNWRNGQFSYYSRVSTVGEVCDVVLVIYETQTSPPQPSPTEVER